MVPLLDDVESAVRVWAVHSLACERCKEAESAIDEFNSGCYAFDGALLDAFVYAGDPQYTGGEWVIRRGTRVNTYELYHQDAAPVDSAEAWLDSDEAARFSTQLGDLLTKVRLSPAP